MKAFKDDRRSTLKVAPIKIIEATHLQDARSLTIPNGMRVGARVFRTGTPVSEVLAAATAAYQAHPVSVAIERPEVIDDARQATKEFLHHVRKILGYDETLATRINENTRTALKTMLDAFMASSVADIEPEDRDAFAKRLREELAQ